MAPVGKSRAPKRAAPPRATASRPEGRGLGRVVMAIALVLALGINLLNFLGAVRMAWYYLEEQDERNEPEPSAAAPADVIDREALRRRSVKDA